MKKVCIFFISIVLVVFCCFINAHNELRIIKSRGVLLVGTTGDYCPMSCIDKNTNSYVGFDIALAEDLAKSLGVKIKYIPTSWQSLSEDTSNKKFDIAIGGITVTDERKKQALMSKGYLTNGKTILCRKEDVSKYKDLDSINQSGVRVMENPGGLNEKFAKEHLPKARLIIHNVNYEIPELISLKKADVMITETIEAKYYSRKDKNLAAPLAETPFTQGQIGILMPKENKHLLKYTNKFIDEEKKSGRLDKLKEKYINIKA